MSRSQFSIPSFALASGTITVPAGSNRAVTLRAYDAGGILTHDGSATLNIHSGTNATVAITLTPLTGDQAIVVTLGSFTITVTPSSPTVAIRGTVQLNAAITDWNGAPTTGTVSWATQNPGVATVDATGLVGGADPSGSLALAAGSNRRFAIQGYDAGGDETPIASLTVCLQPGANPTIAILLTPLTGDVPIEVTLGSFAVIVTPAADSLLIGDTLSLTAMILDANGTPVPGHVVWGALSPRAANVVSTGTQTARVTAIRPGRTTEVATYGGTAAPAAVAVLGWFATPGGSGTGDGSRRPWDLQTALHGGNGKVQPGDTVWLRAGTYSNAAPVSSTLAGTASAPVVVPQYPGERAILDARGATSSTSRGDFFTVLGDYSTFWGFEVMDSDPNRSTSTRPNMIVVHASHVHLVNLIVHDGGVGVYTFSEPGDIEIYRCLAYNNGWEDSSFCNGHSIYAESTSGPGYLLDN